MILDNEELDRLAMMWLVSTNNPELRLEIELQLISLSQTNNRFSREYFYAYHTISGREVKVQFIPGTSSYLDYGSQLVVLPRFVDVVIETLRYNIDKGISTYGLVSATDVNRTLDMRQSIKLSASGFNTSHVMAIDKLF